MQNFNNFSRGLHRSNSPITQPEGSYPAATNWLRNDEGRLINEELEELIQSKEGTLKGFTYLDEEVITFITNPDGSCEIGIFDSSKQYTNVYLDSDFEISLNFGDIDAVARYNYKGDRIVYFVDGSSVRYFNLDDGTFNTLESFNLQLDYKVPVISSLSLDNGSLPTGIYQIIVRYASSIDNKTSFGLASQVVNITDGNSINNQYDGAPPQSISNKGINFTVGNLDERYPFIEPIIITYEGNGNILTCKSLGLYANNINSISFKDISQLLDEVPLEEIEQNPLFYSGAKCIEHKDNTLVLSNLKSKEYDRSFQEVANNIKVLVNPIDLPYSNSVSLTNIVPVRTLAPSYPTSANTIIQDNSTNSSNPNKDFTPPKGFKRGEIYSLSITPIYKDGSLGFAYHIPANTKELDLDTGLYTTDLYQSREEYNNVEGLSGSIRHHKMPDLDEYPLYDGSNITILKLKLTNIVFTTEQQSLIQGYIIGFQEREGSLNTSIVTEGINRPYIANGSLKKSSIFNGSLRIEFTSGVQYTYEPQPTGRFGWQFFSPDFIHNKPIYGNKFGRIGYAKGISTDIAYNNTGSLGNASIVFNQTDWRDLITTPSNITDFTEVPVINSRTYINDIYEVRGTKGYLHIETEAGVYPTFSELDNGIDAFYRYDLNNNDYFSPHSDEGIPSETNFSIFRLYNENDSQYGKLENAKYLQTFYSIPASDNCIIEGDTYINKYWFDLYDGVEDNVNVGPVIDPESRDVASFRALAGIFIESTNNYALKHTEDGGVPYFQSYKTVYNINAPLGLFNIDFTKGYSIGYNKQYSIPNRIKNTFSKPVIFTEVTSFPNRSIYSTTAFEGEIVDSYRLFPANNFHDIPKENGEITDTFVFNNNFYHHTKYCLYRSFFNPFTTQATSQGEVVLGNAGIFRLPSIPILDIKGGRMGTFDKSGLNTPYGRVFIDHSQGKVFLLTAENPTEISDLGLYSFFRNYINKDTTFTIGEDVKNKRILLSDGELAISYYPKTNTWTSFHDFAPNKYFNLSSVTYGFKNSFFQLENSDDARKESSITIVANNDADLFKRFYRAEINSMSGGSGGISSPGSILSDNYYFKNNTFSTIQCWNERQNTGVLPLVIFDNFLDYSEYYNTLVPVQLFKGDFKLELPLNAVVDSNEDIFLDSNINQEQLFKDPLTSKYLYLKLTYNQRLPLVLSYIKVVSTISDY